MTGFEEFWKQYPRKVGKGKAELLWKKLKVTETLKHTILAAIAQQKDSNQWTKSGGEFIPHPSTWLAQKRWEDEPDDFRTPSRFTTDRRHDERRGEPGRRTHQDTCICCKVALIPDGLGGLKHGCKCKLWSGSEDNFCDTHTGKCRVCCGCKA